MAPIFAALLLASVAQAEGSRPLITLPLTVTTHGIYIPVSISGSPPILYQLDTAAGWHITNWKTAEQLHLTFREHRAGAEGAGDGSTRAAEILGAKLALGSLQMPFTPAAAIDLDPIADLKGNALNGLIGAPLFRRYIVETDIEARVFRLYDPAVWKYEGHAQALPVRMDSMGIPHLEVSFSISNGPPLKGEFEIDSAAGFTNLYLSWPFAVREKILERMRESGTKLLASDVSGVGGSSKLWLARITQAKVGSVVFDKPVIGITEAKGGTLARADIAGIIGGGFLHRFKVIYDCPHSRLYLEPATHLHDDFEEDMSGLKWVNAGEGRREFRVRAVLPDSPAALTSIQPGDVLVSVDGRAAREFDRTSLESCLRQPGRKVRLDFRRGDRVFQVNLTLARMI